MTENSYRFFSNRECQYYPCHEGIEEMNCLFCYCPLYALGRRCGGNFVYNEKGFKDCSNCMVPHRRENYEYIISRYRDILAMVQANDAREE